MMQWKLKYLITFHDCAANAAQVFQEVVRHTPKRTLCARLQCLKLFGRGFMQGMHGICKYFLSALIFILIL